MKSRYHWPRAGLAAAILLLSATGSASTQAETVYADSFSSGNISGWSATGNVDAHDFTIRLRGSSSATLSLSTAGYSSVSVAMTMSAGSLENGEFCYGEISTDGGSSWRRWIPTSLGARWKVRLSRSQGMGRGVFGKRQEV